jgi:hypothetical protein
VYIQDQDDLAAYTMKARKLQQAALPPDESAAFIKDLISAQGSL